MVRSPPSHTCARARDDRGKARHGAARTAAAAPPGGLPPTGSAGSPAGTATLPPLVFLKEPPPVEPARGDREGGRQPQPTHAPVPPYRAGGRPLAAAAAAVNATAARAAGRATPPPAPGVEDADKSAPVGGAITLPLPVLGVKPCGCSQDDAGVGGGNTKPPPRLKKKRAAHSSSPYTHQAPQAPPPPPAPNATLAPARVKRVKNRPPAQACRPNASTATVPTAGHPTHASCGPPHGTSLTHPPTHSVNCEN